MPRLTSHRESGGRYLGLRLVGALFLVLGVLLLIAGCLLLPFAVNLALSFGAGTPPGETVPFTTRTANGLGPASLLVGPLSIVWSIALLGAGLQHLAIGGLIRLVIHLEENTRVTAQCLERLASRLDPDEPRVSSMFRS